MLVNLSKRQASMPDLAEPAIARGDLEIALQSAPSGERRRAAHALRDFAEAVSCLCGQLGQEADASVRTTILTSLIHLRSERVVRGLVDYLRSDNAALRSEVIEALQKMPDEALPVLDELLTDTDSDVRIFTVNILSVLPHPHTRNILARVIATDQHVNVCMAALDGLLESGDETVLRAVEALPLRFPDLPFVKFAVSMTLKRLEGTS